MATARGWPVPRRGRGVPTANPADTCFATQRTAKTGDRVSLTRECTKGDEVAVLVRSFMKTQR
jgi:hypothetical protein